MINILFHKDTYSWTKNRAAGEIRLSKRELHLYGTDRKLLPIALAHEIGHVKAGHLETGPGNEWAEEVEAWGIAAASWMGGKAKFMAFVKKCLKTYLG